MQIFYTDHFVLPCRRGAQTRLRLVARLRGGCDTLATESPVCGQRAMGPPCVSGRYTNALSAGHRFPME